MCALPECNCSTSRLTSENCASSAMASTLPLDLTICEENNQTIKTSEEADEFIYATSSSEAQNSDITHNFIEHKSLYMSKGCKYSFIASDYISPEGQKLLNIKVYEKPIEVESCNSKSKIFLSKRSISEYFLSKSGLERDSHEDRGRGSSLLKTWQRTFCKPQIVSSRPSEEYDLLKQPSDRNKNVRSSLPQVSHKSSCSLQQSHSFDPHPSGSDNPEKVASVLLDKSSIKSINPNPNVNFKVFDIESLSEAAPPCDNEIQDNVQYGVDDAWFIPSARHTFSGADMSASASTAQLSIASSFGDSSMPTCKVCHTAAKPDDPLISPCRCTGTLRYIHCGCLMKWLNICNKRSRKPPTCELCKYQFHWHKKFTVRHCQFPQCSWQDKILHAVFIISVLIMITCGIVTILCFKQQKNAKTEIPHLELTQSEIVTLICGALFFLAFFLAMYVEIKARNTIYKLMRKFVHLNQQWYIDEYDKKENSAIDV